VDAREWRPTFVSASRKVARTSSATSSRKTSIGPSKCGRVTKPWTAPSERASSETSLRSPAVDHEVVQITRDPLTLLEHA
jgi:hypothetical protein